MLLARGSTPCVCHNVVVSRLLMASVTLILLSNIREENPRICTQVFPRSSQRSISSLKALSFESAPGEYRTQANMFRLEGEMMRSDSKANGSRGWLDSQSLSIKPTAAACRAPSSKLG